MVGGAITRIAALKFTRDEALGPVAALKHAAGKLPSYSLPPLVALCGAAVFAVQLAVLGVLMRLDFFAFLAGLVWPFVLMLGLLMAILLLGALIGWPFMWATISVEGTDAFDALSRSYAYTYQRPFRLLWYVLFAALLAALSMFVVKMFAASAIALGDWSIDWGLDQETMDEVVRPNALPRDVDTEVSTVAPLAPPALEPPARADVDTDTVDEDAGQELGMFRSGARRAIYFWKSLMAALAAGYQAGFLWVAAVGVYLLLRRDIDGVQTTEVYLDQDEAYGHATAGGRRGDWCSRGLPHASGPRRRHSKPRRFAADRLTPRVESSPQSRRLDSKGHHGVLAVIMDSSGLGHSLSARCK